MNKKKRVIGGLVIFLAVVLLVLKLGNPANELILKGEVEADVSSQVAEVSGKILEFPAELGQPMTKGTVLAVLDDTDQCYLLEQLRAARDQKQAVLDELKKGAEKEELLQAGDSVIMAQRTADTAQGTYDNQQDHFSKLEVLYQQGGVSKQDYDNAKYQADSAWNSWQSAKAQLDSAKQKEVLLIKGADEAQYRQAEAILRQAQVQVEQAEKQLSKFTVYADCSGTLMSRNFSVGDVVSQGNNLADISSQEERYLVAYIPEEFIGSISYGQKLAIKGNHQEGSGTVAYIGVTAQYTPKELQTQANKNKESMKLRIRLDAKTPLKPGEKAETMIPL